MVNFAIVADIGGTNARFSRVNLSTLELDHVVVYPCADFASLTLALSYYRSTQQLNDIAHVAVAIACPVNGDLVKMTNFHWQFSISQIKAELELAEFIAAAPGDRCAALTEEYVRARPILYQHQAVYHRRLPVRCDRRHRRPRFRSDARNERSDP